MLIVGEEVAAYAVLFLGEFKYIPLRKISKVASMAGK